MLTTRKAFVLLLGGSVALTACSDQSRNSLTAPSRPTISAAVNADRSATNKDQQITGYANFIVTNEGNPQEWYAVDAHPDKDAASTSLFTFAHGNLIYGLVAEGGFRIHASMYCFKVEGNRANLAARVETSTNPNVHEGDYLTWRIEDNGNGERRPPDRTTQLFLLRNKADAQDFCAFGGDANHLFFPVKGNLKIHDE